MPYDMPIATVGCDELARHIDANDAFLLDLRPHAHGAQIYGAIRYDPKKLVKAERLVLPLPKDDGFIVLYDEDGTSATLHALAIKLRDDGYGRVTVLDGGFRAWTEAEGRTEGQTLEQPVPTVSEHQIRR